ncbi:hypothetical protein M8J71_20005 [Pseudarthrobacter sp. R1]|nr:hypothetical protein [Pseudarthrobacter sp. R1]MCQ6272745.1 hypothetical protein [Pseudarthrobacter sp. R1]
MADGATLIGMLAPGLKPDLVEALAARPLTALALDAVPRISRAQSMDVLSSLVRECSGSTGVGVTQGCRERL